jgi:hypothetical protein
MALLARVDLKPDRVEIKLRRQSLVELLHAQSTWPSTQGRKSDKEDLLTLKVKTRLQRVGREMRMLVENRGRPNASRPRPAENYLSRVDPGP